MSKVLHLFEATCVKADIRLLVKAEESLSSQFAQKQGILIVYQSEKLHPGMPYFVFLTEEQKLQTSCGVIIHHPGSDLISLRTRTGNYYEFFLHSELDKELFQNVDICSDYLKIG